MLSIESCGTHFEGIYDIYKNADYNLVKAICEYIDNIILKCNNIDVNIQKDSDGKIDKILISDDNLKGFESILKSERENPFNFTHKRIGHQDDNETSQFGIGMKAASIAIAKVLTVYTKTNNKYYRVVLDFEEMCKREDSILSFQPNIYESSFAEYNKFHKYSSGSSIYLSNIRSNMFSSNLEEDLKTLKNELNEIYNNIIKQNNCNIFVNNEKLKVLYSFFDHDNCKPFNRTAYLFTVLEKSTNKELYFYKYNQTFKIFNRNTEKFNNYTYNEFEKKIGDKSYEYLDSFSNKKKYSAIINTTFTKFHPKFNCENDKREKDDMPRNILKLYRDGRKYGDWDLKKRSNGSNNYTASEIHIKSKKLARDLGLTFNKAISNIHNNIICSVIDCLKTEICKGFTADSNRKEYVKLYDIAIKKKISVLEEFEPSSVKKKRIALIELEKKKQEELEKKKQAELEKKKQEELEKKKRAELEKKTQAELEKKKQAELEKEKQAELEKKKQAELEKKKQAELEKKKQAELEKKKQEELLEREMNYQGWKTSVYFGILDCNKNKGISAKDGYYRCHFGITNDDPKHRDTGSGLGINWRRIFTLNINNKACEKVKGKLAIEWEIYKIINEKYNITWEENSHEYFKCKLESFNNIYKTIVDLSFKYV